MVFSWTTEGGALCSRAIHGQWRFEEGRGRIPLVSHAFALIMRINWESCLDLLTTSFLSFSKYMEIEWEKRATDSFSFCLTWPPSLDPRLLSAICQLTASLVRHCFSGAPSSGLDWPREYFCQRLIFNLPPLCGEAPPPLGIPPAPVCPTVSAPASNPPARFICFQLSFCSMWYFSGGQQGAGMPH